MHGKIQINSNQVIKFYINIQKLQFLFNCHTKWQFFEFFVNECMISADFASFADLSNRKLLLWSFDKPDRFVSVCVINENQTISEKKIKPSQLWTFASDLLREPFRFLISRYAGSKICSFSDGLFTGLCDILQTRGFFSYSRWIAETKILLPTLSGARIFPCFNRNISCWTHTLQILQRLSRT